MDFAKIMLASFFLIAIPSGAFAREPVLQEFYAVPASPKALPIPISMGEFWSSLNEPVCESVEYRPTWWLPQNVEVRRAIYYPAMAQVACEYGLPTRLLDAVIAQESGYNPRAISPVGAMGMMQVMPGTARSLGLAFPWDPIANMRAGARYLRDQANRFGRIDLALAAYNAGPERKSLKAGYIPAIPETMTYVRTITTNWARLAAEAPIDSGTTARASAANLAIKASGYREVDLSVYEGMNAANPI
ncbi:MAG TPA: lytic transglycosylase domain-containing protein [Promineifilum sp.]|nr:lytic transglycosylase domain-containing protein [Promineifilum sp.]